MRLDIKCPCCSGKNFEKCCNPLLLGHSPADTPEMLMRSRYSAYVVHDADYLLTTWSKSERPRNIEFDNATIWLNLEITNANPPSPGQKVAYVTFIASFLQGSFLHKMEEKSRFSFVEGKWFYHDGELNIHKSKIALNAKCPCGSRKKYKRCCHK